jgi:hypothetical protein
MMRKAPTKTRVAPKPVQAGEVAQISEGMGEGSASASPADAGSEQPDTALAGGALMPPATVSTDTSESDPRGGSGDPAAPASEQVPLLKEEELADRFPLTHAALRKWLDGHGGGLKRAPQLHVVAKVDGFRRGGRAHNKEGALHSLEGFTIEQLEQIFGEANLLAAFD